MSVKEKGFMKRLFLLLIFVAITSIASAWTPRACEGVVILATKHLTPETKQLFERYLGATYSDDVRYLYTLRREKATALSKEVHYVHLDKSLKPMQVEGDDALVAIEGALEVVRDYRSRSAEEVCEALRTVITLICDIHNFSRYRIEGIPHSFKDFKFTRNKKDSAPQNGVVTLKWTLLWDRFPNFHRQFSGSIWAEDMATYSEGRYAEYTDGSLRDWVRQTGAKSANYLAVLKPNVNISQEEFWTLEEVNYDMMVCASLRLSALLNRTIK